MKETTAPSVENDDELDEEEFAYECPECGEGHDGMITGTEYCPACQDDIDHPEDDDEDEE